MLIQLPEVEEIPETVETVDISISVNDGTDPVEHASVSIGQISSTTGSAGGCTLQDVPEGSQTIVVTATGYEEYTDTIEVSSQNNEFTITLTEESQGG